MADKPSSAPDAPRAGDHPPDEDHVLDACLAASPSERLAWLEEALAFAWKMGALDSNERNGVPLIPRRQEGSQRPNAETVRRLLGEIS